MTTTDPLIQDAAPDRLLNVQQVAARLSISARQTWKLAAVGRIPKPLKLSRSARWRESDLAKFLADGCRMTA